MFFFIYKIKSYLTAGLVIKALSLPVCLSHSVADLTNIRSAVSQWLLWAYEVYVSALWLLSDPGWNVVELLPLHLTKPHKDDVSAGWIPVKFTMTSVHCLHALKHTHTHFSESCCSINLPPKSLRNKLASYANTYSIPWALDFLITCSIWSA